MRISFEIKTRSIYVDGRRVGSMDVSGYVWFEDWVGDWLADCVEDWLDQHGLDWWS